MSYLINVYDIGVNVKTKLVAEEYNKIKYGSNNVIDKVWDNIRDKVEEVIKYQLDIIDV